MEEESGGEIFVGWEKDGVKLMYHVLCKKSDCQFVKERCKFEREFLS
jgi:hypothetical protein